jgi:RNA-directed DNA polymerase
MIINQISREIGVPEEAIRITAHRASHMYRVYNIPKRVGGGTRTIEHPAKPLKTLQRWIAVRMLSQLPVHEAVFSYRPRLGIRQHAEVHRHNRFLLRLDLRDFFPSISRRSVEDLLARHMANFRPAIDEDDVLLLTQLVCRFDRITIGAPSSPSLSNAVFFSVDVALAGHCAAQAVAYSRYADDMYFSTNEANLLTNLLPVVRATLARFNSAELRINEEKSTYTSPKRKRVVTGLVITPQGELSVGRDRKRQIRTLIHLFRTDQLPPEDVYRLKGLLSYVSSVEPAFVDSVIRKFGPEVIGRLIGSLIQRQG